MNIKEIKVMDLWENTPGMCEEIPKLTAYIPSENRKNSAVVILPGGGYAMRAPHEGDGYARFLCEHGYFAFVCDYRVLPHRFPLPLIDSRRAVQTVRHMAAEYGFDKNKVAIMGSSAGGHLAAMTSTHFDKTIYDIDDEIGKESFIPNAQILCYPVINLAGKEGDVHFGSGKCLLGDEYAERAYILSPTNIVSDKTPPAFIWHTFADDLVNIKNSLSYATSLRDKKINSECHFYPDGVHGLGLSEGDDKVSKHVSEWSRSLLLWLEYIGF